jgi:hypothetical protein
MAKITASIQVKSNAKLVRKGLENLRAALPKIGNHRALEAATEIARRMARPGKRIKYPVNWDSVKQKIKVIIMILRKQGFLPYKSTHAHERGWKVERTSNGAKTYNAVRGSKYLYGTMRNKRQSNIHVGRHLIFRIVYDAVVSQLPKKIKESLKKVPKATNG